MGFVAGRKETAALVTLRHPIFPGCPSVFADTLFLEDHGIGGGKEAQAQVRAVPVQRDMGSCTHLFEISEQLRSHIALSLLACV